MKWLNNFCSNFENLLYNWAFGKQMLCIVVITRAFNSWPLGQWLMPQDRGKFDDD